MELVVMELLFSNIMHMKLICKGLIKMNHNYRQTYLSMSFAPPPCKPFRKVISEEGVDMHLPSSKEGAF